MRTMLSVMVLILGCGEPQPTAMTDASPHGDAAPGDDDGGVGDVDGWYKSGTRIKMVVLNTPDGAKQFSGWHDTLRNEDCAFVATPGGMSRCLPTTDAASRYVYAASYFADASCTVPVAQVAASCSPLPTYILTVDHSGCSGSPVVHTAVNLRGNQMYTSAYLKNGASCTSVAANPAYVYYGLGPSVALTEFQSATRAVE